MARIVWPKELWATADELGVPIRYAEPGERLEDGFDVARMPLGDFYRKVPEVRTVVGFLARSVAGVPVHVFKRAAGGDRERLRDGALVELLSEPMPGVSLYAWMEGLTADLAVHDRAYARKVRDVDGVVTALVRVPPNQVTAVGDGLLEPDRFDVNGARGVERVELGDMLWIAGHDPGGGWHGSPILEALREDLAEALELTRARRMVWQRGPKLAAIIKRDSKWSSPDARARFVEGVSQFANGGGRAGTVMLLEDGMEYQSLRADSMKDSQAVEARAFTRQVVASAFGVPLSLLGDADGATFATATAQRRVLYSETLSGWFARIAAALNGQVVPELAGPGVFVEFTVEAKLRGAFEEQAAVLSSSVGGPWMTRNEARARMNLPALDGGDELIVPLNVTEGGQASPRDVPGRPPAPGGGDPVKGRESGGSGRVRVKSGGAGEGEHRGTVEDVLRRHFGRQETVVLAALRNGDASWWDGERWDRELAKDLADVATDLVNALGPAAAKDLGFTGDEFDVPRTLAWLRKVTAKRAAWINEATRAAIVELLDAVPVDGEPERSPGDVFEDAKTSRAVAGAAALTATLAGFAVTEAARQLAPSRAVKTWVVSSSNPRASHAAMNGETVPVGEAFSNGMAWPGDPVGGVDEVAGCTCSVVVEMAD